MTTTFTRVGLVPVERTVNAQGKPPLFLAMHVADGETSDGRSFSITTSGARLIVHLDAHKGDEARAYAVSGEAVVNACLADVQGRGATLDERAKTGLQEVVRLARADLEADPERYPSDHPSYHALALIQHLVDI